MRIAIDTGGTFTDCIYRTNGEIRVLKVFSTPSDPADGVLQALQQIAPDGGAEIRHGTTVGTNALLERKGARAAFVTTAGFEDMITIGRQTRPQLYDWFASPAPPLVSKDLRFGVFERTLFDGTQLQAPDATQLKELGEKVRAAGAESVAISLLFSFANPENERRVANALSGLGIPVSVSHEILPEFREYERSSTVLVNAYLTPKMSKYIDHISSSLHSVSPQAKLHVMQSSGGIVSAAVASREPVRTILSGPAGGVVGACALARLSKLSHIITFDMGGTSTDVALVEATDGAGLRITNEAKITGIPVAVPTLDIHTVGAGGGSLASFDAGGALRVGPESAGADPGPICYGRGTRPTVTDANLLLGRQDPDCFLGGEVTLDEQRARRMFEEGKGKLESIEVFADGIVRIAEATMEKALRMISVERGHDPRDFTLVSFGGAGPLHACALAQSLSIPRVMIPCFPGALSALGISMADIIREYSRTVMLPSDHAELENHFRQLEKHGVKEMETEGLKAVALRSLDMRYVGQGYELNVGAARDSTSRFHKVHRQRHGYADAQRAVEVVNLRVRMVAATKAPPFPRQPLRRGNGSGAILKRRAVYFDGRRYQTPVYDRSKLVAGDRFVGPALVVEYSATAAIPPRCKVRADEWQNLIIEVDRGKSKPR
jgi:N-methylhydantoinase A